MMREVTVAAAFAFAVQADTGAIIKTNSKNNTYKSGETALVDVSFADKDRSVLQKGLVDIWADDGWTNVVFKRTVDLSKEKQPVRLELSRSTPGSLRIHVEGKAANVRHKMDRLIFDVDKIMPLTPCPPDFEEYWRSEQKRLEREIPIDVVKTPAPELSTKDHDIFRVSFATFDNSRVYGLLAIPKGSGKFPAIVNVPGAGIGVFALHPLVVRNGWITLCLNVHCFPMGKNKDEQQKNYDAWFKEYATKAGEPRYQTVGYSINREAPVYHKSMLGMTRAIDWLAAQPFADNSRFVYYGCSQGGGFGLYLTALWGRFAKSLVLCPNKCDMLAFTQGRQPGSSHIMCQKPENMANALKNAPYHDVCNFARLIRTPIAMTYGTADDNCQTVGGIAAFNCIASKEKHLRLLPGLGHGWHKADLEQWLFDFKDRTLRQTTLNSFRHATQVHSGKELSVFQFTLK